MIEVYARLAFQTFLDQDIEYLLEQAGSVFKYNIPPLVESSFDRFDGIYADAKMESIVSLKKIVEKIIHDIENSNQAKWYAKKYNIPFEIELTWRHPHDHWKSDAHIKIRSIPGAPEGKLMFYVQCAIDICTNYFIREITAEKVNK